MTNLVGQQIGRYQIQEEIGRGGMARVYRALDTLLQRPVALKVLAPQLAVDPEFTRRFDREAVTAANLRHPNIVTIYDVGEHDRLRYIAMEYVRGRSLHAVIQERGALGLGYAVAIMAGVAAALDYAHAQGAVHRDVKPQNVMIDTDGRVLLTDFGIAQAPDDGDGRGERLTRTGVFMGTPEYISPEQASALRVDGRSDLYSLGITAYEVITGAVPFSGATPQLIVAHAQQQPPPLSSIDPGQPHELDLVMARILAKRPEQRFTSGAAFVEALRIVARKHGVVVAGPAQLAELTRPPAPSAGNDTLTLGREPTQRGSPANGPRPQAQHPAPHTPDFLPDGDPLHDAPLVAPPPIPPRRPRPDPVPPRRPNAPRPHGGSGGARVPWSIIAPLLAALFFVLLAVVASNSSTTLPTPTPTATATATATPAPPTATLQPTETPVSPTATLQPTEPPAPTEPPTPRPPAPTEPPIPTQTPIPPTETPVPPTATPVPPTATPAPPTPPTETPADPGASATPTATPPEPPPPTATPTSAATPAEPTGVNPPETPLPTDTPGSVSSP